MNEDDQDDKDHDENTDYDIGYFQAIRDISMILIGLSSYYNAKDLQKAMKELKDQVYSITISSS